MFDMYRTKRGQSVSTDLGVEVAELTAFHLSFADEPGYWEDYRGGGGKAPRRSRLEFREGWQTVYPTTVEAVLVRVTLADGSVGWGESNSPIGPEVTALICKSLLTPMVLD